MTNRKGQNSILFIATLGVYLGLVLAGGAAPQVYAHAAITRHFEIQDEIEVKDDLDKKPDDDAKNLARSLDSYLDEVSNFVESLQKLHSIQKFDPDFDDFDVRGVKSMPCDVDGDPVGQTTFTRKIANRWLDPALMDAISGAGSESNLSDCAPSNKFNSETRATDSVISLSFDKSKLEYSIGFTKATPQDAGRLVTQLRRSLQLVKLDPEDVRSKVLLANTVFTSQDSQVFIVTRLPRADLDSLLALNAK